MKASCHWGAPFSQRRWRSWEQRAHHSTAAAAAGWRGMYGGALLPPMTREEERLRGYRSAELQDLQELLADRLLTEELYRAEVKYVLGQEPSPAIAPAPAQESWDHAAIPAQPSPGHQSLAQQIPAQPSPGQQSLAQQIPAQRSKRTAFEKGDSNRCRNVYEQILRADLPPHILDAQKKNKHVSVGRCRMLAINHRVALPPYEHLSRAGFIEADVPREHWCVPADCKRFLKKLPDEGLCTNSCKTCDVPRTLQSICG